MLETVKVVVLERLWMCVRPVCTRGELQERIDHRRKSAGCSQGMFRFRELPRALLVAHSAVSAGYCNVGYHGKGGMNSCVLCLGFKSLPWTRVTGQTCLPAGLPPG